MTRIIGRGIVPGAFMMWADTGFQSPGTVVSANLGAGGPAWTNPGNAVASDDSDATHTPLAALATTESLVATNFSFSLPSGADVIGMEVQIEAAASSSDVSISLVTIVDTGPAAVGIAKTPFTALTGADVIYPFGALEDLWGLTPSEADVESADWGFAFTCLNANVSTPFNLQTDHMQMKIYYTR